MADLDRPTKEEIEEREDFAFELLSRALLKSQIKTLFIKKYACTARTFEKYLSRARARMIELSGKDKAEHIQDAIAFYTSAMRNGEATVREKILARQALDALLALNAPQEHKVEHSGTLGGLVPIINVFPSAQQQPTEESDA